MQLLTRSITLAEEKELAKGILFIEEGKSLLVLGFISFSVKDFVPYCRIVSKHLPQRYKNILSRPSVSKLVFGNGQLQELRKNLNS